MPTLTQQEAETLASSHLASLEPPCLGYVWALELDQEISDAWLFTYAFRPLEPSTTEYPMLAGALGFSVAKLNGQIQPLAASQWFQVKQQGHLTA